MKIPVAGPVCAQLWAGAEFSFPSRTSENLFSAQVSDGVCDHGTNTDKLYEGKQTRGQFQHPGCANNLKSMSV